MAKVAYCQCTFARDVQRTLECVSLMSEHVDYVFIIADESVSPSQLELIGSNFDNVVTKRVHFADDIPAFRNNYLELCEQYGIDWVLVSDPDELFCHEFAKDLRKIISDLEREGYNMAGINCREQFEAVEWLDDLDLLKECPAGYRKSAFYKNLLFRMRKGLRYIGVGVGRVHETFNINGGWRVKLLPADKYWYVHCFDEETEILTREGWKRFADLTEGDEVMTLNPETGRMEYQKPVEIIKHHYKGYMYLHESQRLNFCVTPYHRMYVKKYWDKNSKTGLSFEEYVKIARDSKTGRFTEIGKVGERGFRLIPISELVGKWEVIYKRAGGRWEGEEREFFELPGYIRSYGRRWYNNGTKLGKERLRQIPSKNIPMNLWLKFFGYWLADGWVEGSKSGNCKNYIISLSASKYVDEVRKVIAELCDLLGVKWRERKREGKYYNKEYKTPLHVFEFQSKQLWLYLSKIGNAHTKYIPQEFKELCPKQLKILVEWMLKGDGTGLDTSHPQYTTRNKRLADDFQEVALKAGYAATISECDGEYFVSLSEEDEVLTTKEEGKWISYDGYVYCVSVPNEIILVRRRGKTLWSGNSKSSLDIWRNAARNMVIAGGGDNVGDANPYWRKLRNLMQKYGIKSWMELEERIKNKDVPSEMVNFFIECLDAPRTNWGIETRQLAKFFLYYNREYLTPDVLSKVRERPKQDKESKAKEFVTKCYFFLLGRHPDGAGLEHYAQKLLSGDMSEEDVAVAIAESAEFEERMSGLSVEDIVNRCYNLVLGRNVDASGLKTYGSMLRDGRMTVSQLLRILFRSDEYAKKRKNNPQDRDAEFLRKWKRLLRIPLKAETGGRGIDKTPEEELRRKIERFKRYVPPQQFRRVLDIGAGDGLETLLLMREGYDVVGITLGFDNLIRASEKYGVHLYEMDMHNLQFNDRSFDAIFCAQTFEHAFSAWLLVIEMRRVLRDGGRVFIEVPDPDNDELLNTIWHVNMLYPRQIIALFRKAGFKLVADLSKEVKYTLIFEKLPDGAFDTWGYVKYIMTD